VERTQTTRKNLRQVMESEFISVPRVGPVEAVRRYWLLAILPVLILVPVLGFVAKRTKPTYTAEARMIVGQLNISTPGAIQGYAQAAQDLAATYPLVIDADSVVKPTAAALHVTPTYVRAHLSATQVPTSSIVRIDATGSSATQAIDMANLASKALITYLAKVNSNRLSINSLFAQVARAELSLRQATSKVPPFPKQRRTAAGQRALAAAGTARVRLNAAVQNYKQTLQAQSLTSLLQPVAAAATATSNGTSKLLIALLGGAVIGAILGIGAATLRANMVLRRSLTLPTWDGAPDWPAESRPRSTQSLGVGTDGRQPPERG
jgi:capsular polysaccharide biosynthesis protein